jgi:hypothetical protein
MLLARLAMPPCRRLCFTPLVPAPPCCPRTRRRAICQGAGRGLGAGRRGPGGLAGGFGGGSAAADAVCRRVGCDEVRQQRCAGGGAGGLGSWDAAGRPGMRAPNLGNGVVVNSSSGAGCLERTLGGGASRWGLEWPRHEEIPEGFWAAFCGCSCGPMVRLRLCLTHSMHGIWPRPQHDAVLIFPRGVFWA